MPEPAAANDITLFAETNFRGERKRFGIKREDRRKHVYIIGKTGMGKSTLLENMTIQDIQAGRGVAVVDPHGEYAEKMLDFVPRHRSSDVIYFNPADTDYPVAFNIMEKVGEDQRHLVSSGLLGVFKKIWPDVWSPRMEYLLANAILGLLEIPGATLLGVNRMFGEKEFRRRVVAEITDPVIKGFWENEFAKYPEQFMREAVAAIQNKVGQFSSNPLIRNIIGQVDSAVDMRQLMDEGKIFIVNLAKGKIGEENSRLLGAMLVTKLYLTAMSRVDVPEPERRDFYLYVDEFQNFATESFANILSEARKYRLNLTVAHQYIFQMEEMVQHAIFGNVGTMVVFRIGGEDAELFEKEFMPEFTIQDLVNLGFKNIYVKLMIDGLTSRPFSAETLPPAPRPAETFRENIIQQSRERYGTPRQVVEEKIRGFIQFASEGAAAALVRPEARRERTLPLGARIPSPGSRSDEPGTAREPVLKPSEAERPMYEAFCAVDGKRILVPFQPDGKRPVYCEDHMDLIKYRAKASAEGRPPLRADDSRKDVVERTTEASLSLRSLRSRGEGSHRSPPRAPPLRPKTDLHLAELRRVLAESLRAKESPDTPATSAGSEAPRVLRPGETIRFE